jgi:hypothetical protein
MSMISIASMPMRLEARSGDLSFKFVVLFCCVGLVASFALMAQGVDLNAGLI